MLQEGQTDRIELKAAEGDRPDLADDDPKAVKLMIDYLYLDDYDPKTASAANPIPAVENGKGEESAVGHAVKAAQTVPVHSDQWFSNPGQTAFSASSTGFGTASTGSLFGSAPTAFGAASLQPQPDETAGLFGGSKKKKKGKGLLPPDSFLEMHAKVFAIASKYDIKSLERAARDKFEAQSIGDWSPADLTAAIDIVFNRTPEGETALRNALKDAIVRCAITLVQHPGFEESIAHIDGLAYDLFRRKSYVHR
jgi:hypothetical protein